MKNYRNYVFLILSISLCANVLFSCVLVKSRIPSSEEFDIWGDLPIALKQRQTVMVMDSLLLQITMYASLTGKFPESTDFLHAPFDGDGPNWPIDRFGKKFRYMSNANEATLVSAGVDGVFGTEDDIVGRLSSRGLSREIDSPVGKWSAEELCCTHEAGLKDDGVAD